jgi:hypothetical protein
MWGEKLSPLKHLEGSFLVEFVLFLTKRCILMVIEVQRFVKKKG